MPFSGFQDLDPRFSPLLQKMLAANPGITVGSGYRSPERQAQLYAAAVRKYGSPEKARHWVAPPGRSKHNARMAADLQFANDAARQWAHAHAAEYGLVFPMGHEPWHIEPAGARSGATQLAVEYPDGTGTGVGAGRRGSRLQPVLEALAPPQAVDPISTASVVGSKSPISPDRKPIVDMDKPLSLPEGPAVSSLPKTVGAGLSWATPWLSRISGMSPTSGQASFLENLYRAAMQYGPLSIINPGGAAAAAAGDTISSMGERVRKAKESADEINRKLKLVGPYSESYFKDKWNEWTTPEDVVKEQDLIKKNETRRVQEFPELWGQTDVTAGGVSGPNVLPNILDFGGRGGGGGVGGEGQPQVDTSGTSSITIPGTNPPRPPVIPVPQYPAPPEIGMPSPRPLEKTFDWGPYMDQVKALRQPDINVHQYERDRIWGNLSRALAAGAGGSGWSGWGGALGNAGAAFGAGAADITEQGLQEYQTREDAQQQFDLHTADLQAQMQQADLETQNRNAQIQWQSEQDRYGVTEQNKASLYDYNVKQVELEHNAAVENAKNNFGYDVDLWKMRQPSIENATKDGFILRTTDDQGNTTFEVRRFGDFGGITDDELKRAQDLKTLYGTDSPVYKQMYYKMLYSNGNIPAIGAEIAKDAIKGGYLEGLITPEEMAKNKELANKALNDRGVFEGTKEYSEQFPDTMSTITGFSLGKSLNDPNFINKLATYGNVGGQILMELLAQSGHQPPPPQAQNPALNPPQ